MYSIFNLAIGVTPQKGAKKTYNQAVNKSLTFDAIIVPGMPFQNKSWDSAMKARILWSWILYKNGMAKNIIYSGGAVYTPYIESEIMGLYARQLGVPAEHIFCDTQARHSTENIYYSYLLAKKCGFKTIALATDPFQSFMLKSFTRKRFSTPIYHIPFVTDSLNLYNHINPQINPENARVANFESIKSKESFWKRIRGTMGSGIDWGQYPDGRVEPL